MDVSPFSSRLTLSALRVPSTRQFQKKVEEVKQLLRTVEQKDKAAVVLRMQRDDFQACLKNHQNISVKLENGLLQRDADLKQKQYLLDQSQVHCDELRGMLESERDVADQLRMRVQRLEDKLENERRRMSGSPMEFLVQSVKSEAVDNLADALKNAGGFPTDCEDCEVPSWTVG